MKNTTYKIILAIYTLCALIVMFFGALALSIEAVGVCLVAVGIGILGFIILNKSSDKTN